jgi:uncharacterized membrane protein YfcA
VDLSVEYAIPTVIAFAAAVVSSCAGFGGAILLLPVLSALYGVQRALPILACAQLVGNASRAVLGYATLRPRIILIFAGGLVPAGIFGTLYLTRFSESFVRPIIATIVCVAALFEVGEAFGRLPRSLHRIRPPHEPGAWFFSAGALVGLISAVGGTAGPLPNAFFLRLNLVPAAYIANEAAAMGLLHLAKLVAFGFGDWARSQDIPLMIVISLAMVLGTYAGKKMVTRIPVQKYRKGIAIWMLFAAASLFFVSAD